MHDGRRVRRRRHGTEPGRRTFALLALEAPGGLVYAGSGLRHAAAAGARPIWTRTEAIQIPKAVLPELRNGNREASFVRPELRVRARHLRGEGMLRHATLIAIL